MKKAITASLVLLFIVFSSFTLPLTIKQDEKGLTVEQFNQKVSNKEKIVLVYFNADWCVPCIKLKPIIEQTEKEEAEKVIFLKINVDDNPEVATHFEINTLPQFYIYRNGKIAWQHTGILTKKDIYDKINLYKY